MIFFLKQKFLEKVFKKLNLLKKLLKNQILSKNPTNSLGGCEQVVAIILRCHAFLTLFCTFGPFLAIYFHFVGKFQRLKKNKIIYNISHVTCHLPPVTIANSHRPSAADSPIIHRRLLPSVKIIRIFEPKDKSPDTLAVIKNYNFCDIQTHMATL